MLSRSKAYDLILLLKFKSSVSETVLNSNDPEHSSKRRPSRSVNDIS